MRCEASYESSSILLHQCGVESDVLCSHTWVVSPCMGWEQIELCGSHSMVSLLFINPAEVVYVCKQKSNQPGFDNEKKDAKRAYSRPNGVSF